MKESHEGYMRQALVQARIARDLGEVPVGAVIVRQGAIVARGHNLRELSADPTAHAEVVAIRAAARALGDWRLTDCALYVTLEPCPMCAGAILMARLAAVYYGASDERGGCCGSVYRITEDPAFTHYAPATGGILSAECAEILESFLRAKRT